MWSTFIKKLLLFLYLWWNQELRVFSWHAGSPLLASLSVITPLNKLLRYTFNTVCWPVVKTKAKILYKNIILSHVLTASISTVNSALIKLSSVSKPFSFLSYSSLTAVSCAVHKSNAISFWLRFHLFVLILVWVRVDITSLPMFYLAHQ